MPNPIFVSFYTPDYAECAVRLRASLERFKLDHWIEPMVDTGRWVANCAQKPVFIRKMLDQHPDRSIVWLDADAEVLKDPELFNTLKWPDIGVCRYVWKKARKSEVLSGTLWFKNDHISRDITDAWTKTQQDNPDQWDQFSLDRTLQRLSHVLVWWMPFEYCYIHDFHRQEHPDSEPIIIHYQKSRETRGLKP